MGGQMDVVLHKNLLLQELQQGLYLNPLPKNKIYLVGSTEAVT